MVKNLRDKLFGIIVFTLFSIIDDTFVGFNNVKVIFTSSFTDVVAIPFSLLNVCLI